VTKTAELKKCMLGKAN
jgi:hypothetical protein